MASQPSPSSTSFSLPWPPDKLLKAISALAESPDLIAFGQGVYSLKADHNRLLRELEQMRGERDAYKAKLSISNTHKVYANAEVQVQLDPQLISNTSPLSSLLTILREKRAGSSIDCVVNVVTIDLARSLLRTKNYVDTALQLTGAFDTELLLDFMLHLLCHGHLSCSEVPDANRRARRLMLKMITKTPVPPSSLFVQGIDAKVDYDYIGRGGFGFIGKNRDG